MSQSSCKPVTPGQKAAQVIGLILMAAGFGCLVKAVSQQSTGFGYGGLALFILGVAFFLAAEA